MSYEEDVEKLASLCTLCGGKCCTSEELTLSKLEIDKLKEKYDVPEGKLESPYGFMNVLKLDNNPCVFLGNKSGKRRCVLAEDLKPLSCWLFPLTFVYEDGSPEFYLSGFCPYANKVAELKEWISVTVDRAKEDLKTWTEIEKKCRSHWHKTHGNLIEISQ